MPTVAAQGSPSLEATMSPQSSSGKPLETLSYQVDITYTLPTQGVSPLEPVKITYSEGSSPPWADVTPTPPVEYLPIHQDSTSVSGDGRKQTFEGSTTVTAFISPSAPGLEEKEIDISVESDQVDTQGGGTIDSAQTSAKAKIKAEYFSVLTFQTPGFVSTGPNQEAVIPVTVVNGGNAPSIVSMTLKEQSNEDWIVFIPNDFDVPADPAEQKDNRRSTQVTVSTPKTTGYYNDLGKVTVNSVARHNIQTGLTSPEATFNTLVHFQGVMVPGFQAPAMAGAFAAAALLVRRRFGE